MEQVRIYCMPPCRMVSSGRGMFGDGVLEAFDDWFSKQSRAMFPKDYLCFDGEGFVWYYVYEEGMQIPEQCEIVDFPGGLYAAATGKDGDDKSREAVMAALEAFIASNSCFEKDPSRAELGSIITPPEAAKALGYDQMDYYLPIRLK